MSKFLDYIRGCRTALTIASRPLDFDCIGSGLILKKYLESLNIKTRLMYPTKFQPEDKQFFSFLPYFTEIKDGDTREILKKRSLDLLIMVDGSNLVQFYDAQYDSSDPPDLSIYPKRIHIDHHQFPEPLGELTFHTKDTSSTTEIVLTRIIPEEFIDKDIATLGYAALVGDTGNFMWSFYPATFQVAARMLTAGAEASLILDKLFFSQTTKGLQAIKFAIEHTQFDDKLATTFLFLPYPKIKKLRIDDQTIGEIKRAYEEHICKTIPDYPRGIIVYEKEPGKINISGRGNTLRNKISLPELFAKLGGNSGGHFNAAGAKIEGDFFEIKKKLLNGLQTSLKPF